MNRKSIVLIVASLSIIFIALTGFFGINPYNDNPVLATYLKWESNELVQDKEGKVYYFLPKIEENEVIRIQLSEYVNLDANATNGKETLKYSIIFDKPEDINSLEIIENGTFAGWLTIIKQTSATIIVSTTDGSSLEAKLYIRPSSSSIIPDEEIEGGDIFN